MKVTSNFNIQKKNFSEISPHNNRIRTKTKNQNIAWKFKPDDILNQTPYNYKELAKKDWSPYVKNHDKTNRHKSQKYGSVHGLFQKRNKVPYKTIVMGFASGKARRQYHRMIHNAYPNVSLDKVLKTEARGMNNAAMDFNNTFDRFKLTDYSVHVDEIKLRCGQVHLQGRMYYHGTTKKGHKPTFNINRTLNQELTEKGYKVQNLNNPQRLRDFRQMTDRIAFHNVSSALEQEFPKAHLDFHFTRTEAQSINHDKWQRKQDLKRSHRVLKQSSKVASNLENTATMNSLDKGFQLSRSIASTRDSFNSQLSKVKSNVMASNSATISSTNEYISHGRSYANSIASSANITASSIDELEPSLSASVSSASSSNAQDFNQITKSNNQLARMRASLKEERSKLIKAKENVNAKIKRENKLEKALVEPLEKLNDFFGEASPSTAFNDEMNTFFKKSLPKFTKAVKNNTIHWKQGFKEMTKVDKKALDKRSLAYKVSRMSMTQGIRYLNNRYNKNMNKLYSQRSNAHKKKNQQAQSRISSLSQSSNQSSGQGSGQNSGPSDGGPEM